MEQFFVLFLLVRLISVLRIFCFLTVNFMALFPALCSMVTCSFTNWVLVTYHYGGPVTVMVS